MPLVMKPLGPPLRPPITVTPGPAVTVGRAETCAVRLDSRHVSKQHARLAWAGGAWSVTDLGSHNGTTVNRWPLAPDEPVILRHGDELALGEARFEIDLEPAPPDTPAEHASATYATRASIFVRLRDDAGPEHEQAWVEFRNRYAPVIVGFSRNAGLRGQDAEDVLQDVMLGFFRRSADFVYDPAKGRFRGYLKRATLNAIRKRARGRQPTLVPDDQLADRAGGDGEVQWEACWAEQVLARAIEEARQRFDARTFEAFELYAHRGVGGEEVADRLALSVNGVHQAKSRVMRLVKAIVEQVRQEEG